MIHIDQERYRIQLPSMSWPDGRTLMLGDKKEELHEVSLSEPLRYRKAVEKLAYYFRREFGYDFPPYTADNALSFDQRTDVVFMWIGQGWDDHIGRRSVGYGACAFDYETCDFPDVETCGADGHWFLTWAWFHPYERRKGHLSGAWPYFQERFGDFGVQYPISESMKTFLDKHHDTAMKKFISDHPKKKEQQQQEL